MSAPHPPLKEYYASEAERGGWVRRLFDRTAGDYDRIEHAMAFGTGSWYRRRALLRSGLSIGMRVLDIGTGTGLTACEAARIVGDPTLVVGVDPSPGMVDCAKVPAGLILKIGTAEAIPADAAAAEFLTMGYALRHIGDLSLAFAEFMRVLAPGGRVCLLEITKPPGRIARALLKAYMRGFVPMLARGLARHRDMPQLMRYYWDTIETCTPPEEILAQMRAAGFDTVQRRVEAGIFSEYCGRKPS
ncbi:MAG: class I SAM-dependent methyltransferase [Steroidobacteraceae bacterium]|jgi:demethylmenaquinone methyltransferase/2-methoxy-6-polyprenyl-1,4-benzoquinol methylase